MPQRQASQRQGRSGSELGKDRMFGKTADRRTILKNI
jgi:hypothetical protein